MSDFIVEKFPEASTLEFGLDTTGLHRMELITGGMLENPLLGSMKRPYLLYTFWGENFTEDFGSISKVSKYFLHGLASKFFADLPSLESSRNPDDINYHIFHAGDLVISRTLAAINEFRQRQGNIQFPKSSIDQITILPFKLIQRVWDTQGSESLLSLYSLQRGRDIFTMFLTGKTLVQNLNQFRDLNKEPADNSVNQALKATFSAALSEMSE
jgi:hypothetical protein